MVEQDNRKYTMKKTLACLCAAVISSFCLIQAAQADEISELKAQMKAKQKQMQAMQAKIEALESTQAVDAAEIAEGPKYLISKKILDKFELGGIVEMEFVNTQSDASTGESEPHLAFDKVCLQPVFHINEDIRIEAALDIEEGGANLDEAYFIFDNLPFNSKLQIGKDDRFFKAEVYTERYPLAGNAFWRDEETGILIETEYKPFYGALSWGNGLELAFVSPGKDASNGDAYDLMQDDGKSSDYTGMKQFAGGLGFKQELGKLGKIDILGWGLSGELSSADISFLQTNLSNYTSNNDDQYRFGVNVSYDLDDLNLTGQYIDAEDGELDRSAWFIQPSYSFDLPFDWKYCKGHRFLLRYGELDVDNTVAFARPATWNREELTLGLISDITKNLTAKIEYTWDDEATGNSDVNNDELVMRLEYEF